MPAWAASWVFFGLAFGFLIRSIVIRELPHIVPNTLLSLFCLLAALIFMPDPLSSASLAAFGWMIALLALAFLLVEMSIKGFHALSSQGLFRFHFPAKLPPEIKEISRAMERLAAKRIGALIALERKQSLDKYIECGTRFDADVKAELLMSLFHASSPLHDGALVISKKRIKAARVILPLTARTDIPYGTRHRSAIGITERTDALVLVVSEERGTMSVGFRGKLAAVESLDHLHKLIRTALRGKAIAAK